MCGAPSRSIQSRRRSPSIMDCLSACGACSLAAMAGGGLSLKNPSDIYVDLLISWPIADAISKYPPALPEDTYYNLADTKSGVR